MKISLKHFLVAISISTALTGCAGVVSKPVLEANKDPSFQYDGIYKASIKQGTKIQRIQTWQVSCPAQEFSFQFSVKESVIDMGKVFSEEQQTGYVDTNGRFRVLIPTNREMKASGRSDSTLDQGAITVVIQGELQDDEPIGYYVQGVKQFNNRGCSYRINLAKI